ncbi:MAG: hypothetical protein PHN88_01770 [Ignavibacteria bacterium]|nr:hypothetical protein [Ignavibacteria bacterium]
MLKTSVVYLLIFSFLLAGCYTTDNYSDTPQNIISGKSKIELNDDFILDSLAFTDSKNLSFNDIFIRFLDCNKDGCCKFETRRAYRINDDKSHGIIYSDEVTNQRAIPDTISINNISKMYYHRGYYDYEVIAIGLVALAGVVYFFLNAFNHFGKP